MLKRIVPLVLALVLCAGLAQAKTKAPATQLPGDLTLADWQAAAVGSVTAPFTFSDYEYLDQIEVQ